MNLIYKSILSPVGTLKLVVSDQALVAILWDNEKPNRVRLETMKENVKDFLIVEVEKQLKEYFQQQRHTFNLPLEPPGTPFQQAVWQSLLEIPFGKTCSYGEIARKIDRPEAVRAVGAAIGRNPISIVIPCHRVIAANGSLTGFAGGLHRKQTLLDIEARDSQF
jgi:methylated-DNA-[protein]-cysteine S-methyltransferase